MNEQVAQIAARLKTESEIRGNITKIAKESGLTARTLQKVIGGHSPNVVTLDKLVAYFRKADRRAKL
jgi:predicted transcriptional regulator